VKYTNKDQPEDGLLIPVQKFIDDTVRQMRKERGPMSLRAVYSFTTPKIYDREQKTNPALYFVRGVKTAHDSSALFLATLVLSVGHRR
jgi:hypothetical protein